MFRIPKGVFVILYLPSMAMITIVAIAAIYKQIPVGSLTRDIASVGRLHPFTGILSNLGILLWCTSAVISLFTWMVICRRQVEVLSGFLLYSSLLTFILLFDDLFLFHEFLAGEYLGFNELTIYIIHFLLTAYYLVTFRREILRTDYFFLLSALVFFATSIAIDKISLGSNPWLFLVEDGSKFLGIVNWCGYFVRTSFQFLLNSRLAATPKSNDISHST